MNCDNFSCLIYDPEMSQNPQAQKYPRGQNVSILPSCILLMSNNVFLLKSPNVLPRNPPY